MFDFSFTEMLLAGLVALIVLGPERLPKVARFVGEWVGKIQRMAAGVKNELAAHADYAELSKIKHDVEQTAQDIRNDLRDFERQMREEHHDISEKIHDSLPAWERLPEPKTPEDFGISTPHLPPIHTAGLQIKSLKKQAMARKRDLRPRHRPTPKFRGKRK